MFPDTSIRLFLSVKASSVHNVNMTAAEPGRFVTSCEIGSVLKSSPQVQDFYTEQSGPGRRRSQAGKSPLESIAALQCEDLRGSISRIEWMRRSARGLHPTPLRIRETLDSKSSTGMDDEGQPAPDRWQVKHKILVVSVRGSITALISLSLN